MSIMGEVFAVAQRLECKTPPRFRSEARGPSVSSSCVLRLVFPGGSLRFLLLFLSFFASCVFSLRPCPTSRKFSLVLPSFQGSSFCPFLQTLPSLSLLFLPRILSLVLVSSQSFSSLLFYFFPCFFFLPFFLLQFFLYLSLLFSNLLVLTTFTRHVFLLPCYSLYYFLSSFSLSLPLFFFSSHNTFPLLSSYTQTKTIYRIGFHLYL